jgi:hypothetical protein
MSIRSDVMVLTVFELIKVSIEIAIKKKRLSIDVLARKKVSRVPPRDTNECHTGRRHNVSSSTQPVAGTSPYTVRTVQQRLHKQGQWIRAKRAEQTEKEFLDRFIQIPEQKCRPFRRSEDETQ